MRRLWARARCGYFGHKIRPTRSDGEVLIGARCVRRQCPLDFVTVYFDPPR